MSLQAKFRKQVHKANAINQNRKWSQNRLSNNVGDFFYDKPSARNYLNSGRVGYLAERAYASKDGYAISKNAQTGDVEMFVRGTATLGEWAQNVVESPFYYGKVKKYSLGVRQEYADRLSRIAKREGVTVVYGHSRGAAVLGDMEGSFLKIGLDGATILNSRKRNEDILNVRQTSAFDWLLARRTKKHLKPGGFKSITGSEFHWVYKSRPKYISKK